MTRAGMRIRPVGAAPCAARRVALPGGLRGADAAGVCAPAQTAVPAAVVKTEAIEPAFVRSFTPVEQNRNDGNPVWSRSGMFLSFERSMGEKRELHVALADGLDFQTVYHVRAAAGGGTQFFFPGVVEDISYNAGISWAPREDRFVFMSNGGEGNYDLYLGDMGGKNVARLTEHKEKDGQPDWSPAANAVVFVSGRTGKGDLYLIDANTKALTRVTQGGKEHLYPQWSPDGKRIAFMSGNNENHDIFVVDAPALPEPPSAAKPGAKAQPPRPAATAPAVPRQLTAWEHDDLRPVWSPDGKKIAFYTNYNPQGDPRIWSIVVVAADGSDPKDGEGLAAKVVATDVVSDVERGPAWMPDSRRIVYVKNDRQEYHPLYVVNIVDRSNKLVKTETKMNHDVACGPDGTIAFRAQVDQWDQVFTARMKE